MPWKGNRSLEHITMENITRRQALLGLTGLAGIPLIGNAADEPVKQVRHVRIVDGYREFRVPGFQAVSVVLGDTSGRLLSQPPLIKGWIFSRPSITVNEDTLEAVWNEFPLLVTEPDSKKILDEKRIPTKFSV